MSRPELEILVERYLAFEMDAEQEQEFIMRAATDAELFRTLRAYRLMDRALGNNRNALLAGQEVDDRALAMLTGTSSGTHRPEDAAPALPAAARPHWLASTWMKMTGIAIFCAVAGFLSHPVIVGDSLATSEVRPQVSAAPSVAPPADRRQDLADNPIDLQSSSSPVAKSPLPQTAPAGRSSAGVRSLVKPSTIDRTARGASNLEMDDRGRQAGVDSRREVRSGPDSLPVPSRATPSYHASDSVTFRAKVVLPKGGE